MNKKVIAIFLRHHRRTVTLAVELAQHIESRARPSEQEWRFEMRNPRTWDASSVRRPATFQTQRCLPAPEEPSLPYSLL
jgi:hypothetical protein